MNRSDTKNNTSNHDSSIHLSWLKFLTNQQEIQSSAVTLEGDVDSLSEYTEHTSKLSFSN